MAWSSPALPYFASESNFSKAEIYWIVPLLSVGCALGFLLNPLIIDKFGTKKTLLLYSIPQLVSWLLLFFSKNQIIVIYLGRLLAGIGYGAGACALTVYLSEIGNRNDRGIFMVIFKLTMSIGSFFTVLIGAYCSHNTMNLFLLMLPVTFLVTFIFMPDSKYFLQINQECEFTCDVKLKYDEKINYQFQESERMLKPNLEVKNGQQFDMGPNLKSRGTEKEETNLKTNDGNNLKITQNDETNLKMTKNDETYLKMTKTDEANLKIENNDEINLQIHGTNLKMTKNYETNLKIENNDEINLKIHGNILKTPKNDETNLKLEEKKENIFKKLFFVSSNRRALMIIIACAAQNVFSGYGITKYFAQNILTYEESILPAKNAVFLLAAISIVSSAISTLTIEKFKRKTLLLNLGCLASISLGVVGLFFYLKFNYRIKYFDWLPLIGLVIFDFSITNGNYNIYLIYQGELLSSEVKSVGITFIKVILMVFTFSASIIYQLLNDFIEISLMFWIFASFCLLQTWIIYKITPETKDKSLDEIQQLLASKIS